MTQPPPPAPPPSEPGAPDPPPDRIQVDGGEPNGFVVVVLDRDVDPDPDRDLADVLRDPGPPGAPAPPSPERLLAVLAELGDPRTTRLVTPGSLDNVRELERRARAAAGGPVGLDLTRFWRIDLRDGRADPQVVARLLDRVAGVDLAYAESRVETPRAGGAPPDPAPPPVPGPVGAVAATATLAQGHLADAVAGIGATAVRTRCGARGKGVRLADVETSWRIPHPAYSAHAPQVVSAPPRGNGDMETDADGDVLLGDHGAAVLGIVAATGPGVRVAGVAPEVAEVICSSHYDVTAKTDMHVALAVADAAARLRAGDVLLLEVQRKGGAFRGALPTEIDPADFSAILKATTAGIVVVEAAGNGERDLDAWRHPQDGRAMARDGRGDSGAIVVGSCNAQEGAVGHLAFSSSNWGARVDCHAWGERVATAHATATTSDYTTNFKETSAAAAIVAGAACATQGMQLAAHPGVPLTPRDVREYLSGPANTPQQPEPAMRPVGRMPDLVAIADRIGAAECPDDGVVG